MVTLCPFVVAVSLLLQLSTLTCVNLSVDSSKVLLVVQDMCHGMLGILVENP